MALINCKECNEKISDQAATCPRCGIELPKTKTRNSLTTILLIGIILVAAFVALDAMFSTNKREMADYNKSLDKLNDATSKAERLIRK